MKINDAILDYVNYLKYANPKSKDTIQSYHSDLKKYAEFLASHNVFSTENIDASLIREYYLSMEASFKRSSIYRENVSIKGFHDYLIKIGDSTINPAASIKVKSQGKRIVHTLSEEEVKRLLSFELVSDKDYQDLSICLLLFSGGLRVSEVISLSLSQLYTEEKMIRVLGKGNKERIVFLNDFSLNILTHYIEKVRPSAISKAQVKDRNLIYLSQKGKPISRYSVYNMIQYRSNKSGINKKISPHTLRHAFATQLLENDVDLRVIQELLGHSDIATTQVYTHVDKKKIVRDYDKYHPGSKLGKQGGKKDE